MRKAFLQLHIAILLAGLTAIFGKLISLNEGLLVWYRMFISAVTLLIIMVLQKKSIRISFKNMMKMSGVGCLIALHWVTFYGSIKYANISVSVTCLSAIGFFTSFLEPLIAKRKIKLTEVLLGMLAITGIYLIFNFYPEYKTGIIFGIVSAMFASIFPILNKPIVQTFPTHIVTLYEMAGGCIFLTAFIPLYTHFFTAQNYLPTLYDWGWLLLLAWVCTVFAFVLQLNALKVISPFTVNLSYNLEPIYSIILAFIFFKESKFLGKGFYAGFALILLAVTLQMVRVWNERKLQKIKAVL